MAVSKEEVEQMINRYVQEVGLKVEDTYRPEKNLWDWRKGSARIEVFIEEVEMGNAIRYYLRAFSPIAKVPGRRKEEFF